jgi:hypothetical protein
LILFAAILCGFARLDAAILLLDPAGSSATNTYAAGPAQPYSVPANAVWSAGSSVFGAGGQIRYSDNSIATGVTIVTDSLTLTTGPAAEYNFTSSPSVSAIGNAGMTGVFSGNPSNNSIYGTTLAGLNYGGVAMKISGLASGTYDIYIVAAYTGSVTTALPGTVGAAQNHVWAFTRESGVNSFVNGSYGTANELLENSTTASWGAGNNYAKITVTINEATPDLFIISQGVAGAAENRGWISSVQIVPEPSSALLGAAGIAYISLRRRRKD